MVILVSNDKLWEILQRDENDELDFKSGELLTNPDGKNRHDIAKHMVGFANHRGGKLIFGVNDDAEPEGINLIEEKCLGTISEIIDAKCSPSINYSYEFFSDSQGDLSDGSILALEIQKRTESPPCAVIESSEGKIRKREYRIRTGDSTRLVTDSELLALFNRDPDLELSMSSSIVYPHMSDLSPVDIEPVPNYFHNLDDLYEMIGPKSEEILELITHEHDGHEYKNYHEIFEIFCTLALLSDLYKKYISDTEESLEERLGDDGIEPIQFEQLTGDDLIHNANDHRLFSKSPFTISEIFEHIDDLLMRDQNPHFGFVVPKGSQVYLGDSINEITISLENHYEMNFQVNWHSTKVGLPIEHPESEGEPYDPKPPKNPDVSGVTQSGTVDMSAQFTYPEQTHEEYLAYKEYCLIMGDSIIDRYDWEEFLDRFPNKKLFQIESKLNTLIDGLDLDTEE